MPKPKKKALPTPALDPSFSAKKPISVWNRPLQLDSKGLFGALAKGAVHGFTGQWTELGGDAVDGLAALGLDSHDAPHLSWLLLRRALVSAMAELIRESLPEIGDKKKDLADLSRQLDEALEEEEVAIDRTLFDRPRDLPLLGAVQEPFAQWLEAYGLAAPAAAAVARRLPGYFVLALHAEWRSQPAVYEPIREAVNTPFTRSVGQEQAWRVYAARLDRQVDEPMFGESFGLRQVYVPLRAFYVVEPPRDRHSEEGSAGIEKTEKEKERRVAVWLEQEIDAWIAAADKKDSYRVLSGGPGSGKSSFLRMYAARAAREGRIRVLFIPLHQLNVAGSLVNAVGDYVRLAEALPANPLDPDSGEERLLLLLDGLDELAMQGRIGAEAARDFVREVLKHVELRNYDRCRLLVLFSGREPVVQASESEFRERRRVLHTLPYFLDEARRKEETWKDSAEILAEDQRPGWWKAYGIASGRGYATLPAELKRKDLDEITAQPLLNYLVALSYDRGRLSFSDALNLNDIYRDLLEAVHDRGYEQRRSLAPSLTLQEFRRVLEEIALAAWHGSGRTTSVSEIEAHCEAAGLSGLLRSFEEGAKAGVTRVLTAFYFRQFGRTAGGDHTFEFTHKSFREYLTALRIIEALELMKEEMDRREQKPGAGWDEAAALKHWAEICGPTRMDRELWVFVRREIESRGKEKALAWQHMLCGLISAMLRNGMPMELLSPRPSYHEESRQARNAEEALLAVLNACARTTEELSHLDWPRVEDGGSSETALGSWLKRLQGQNAFLSHPHAQNAQSFLSYLDLSGQVLDIADLLDGDLLGANLDDLRVRIAVISEAELRNPHMGINLAQMPFHIRRLR
ncbi:MAG TPA: hypothetical protein VN493_24560 [Thermoanaerobaculia bacterium]|nr:hypothetical protein [Thermoanaerobaculia bacterium]